MNLSLMEHLRNETGHNVFISLSHHLSLQVHIQTIGILVSEKSELQTALQYTQHAARQKAGVCVCVCVCVCVNYIIFYFLFSI